MTTKFDVGETVYVPCTVMRINIDYERSKVTDSILMREPIYTLKVMENDCLRLKESQILNGSGVCLEVQGGKDGISLHD